MNGKAVYDEKSKERGQKLVLDNRRILTTSGILDIVSFEQNGALLKTATGLLALDGEELRVVKLDIEGGNITVEGKINGLFFSDGDGKGRSKRLFK